MNMTKEQIDERIKNINNAIAITKRRQDLWVITYGTVNERYNAHLQELRQQLKEIVALRNKLEEN